MFPPSQYFQYISKIFPLVRPCVRPCVRPSSQAPLAHFLPSFLWPGAAFIVRSQGTMATICHDHESKEMVPSDSKWFQVIPSDSKITNFAYQISPILLSFGENLYLMMPIFASFDSTEILQNNNNDARMHCIKLQRQGLHGECGGHFSIPSENGEQHHWMWRLNLFRGALWDSSIPPDGNYFPSCSIFFTDTHAYIVQVVLQLTHIDPEWERMQVKNITVAARS